MDESTFWIIFILASMAWLIWRSHSRDKQDKALAARGTPTEDLSALVALQQKLVEKGHKCEIEKNAIFFPDLFLRVSLKKSLFSQEPGPVILSFRFFFQGGLLDDVLFANLSGTGLNMAEAIEEGLSRAVPLVEVVVDSVKGHYLPEYDFETSWGDRNLSWHCLPSDLSLAGDRPTEDIDARTYPGMVLPALGDYLGNKSFYLVKVYGSKISGSEDSLSECRLDWRLIPEATELLSDYSQKWEVEHFRFDTQFMVLRQCRKGYRPACDTYGLDTRIQLALNWTMNHLDSEFSDLMSILIQLFENKYLAMEYYLFLPEICLPYLLPDLNLADEVTLFNEEGREFTLKKTQWPIYTRLARNVADYFEEHGYDEEQLTELLYNQGPLGNLLERLGEMDIDLGENQIFTRYPVFYEDYTPFQPVE